MRLILLLLYACLTLFVADRVRGFSSGAPEESCASLTVNHTHVGQQAPGAMCGPPCLINQLRLIGSSADNFTYSCNQSYQCELDRETHGFVLYYTTTGLGVTCAWFVVIKLSATALISALRTTHCENGQWRVT